MDGQEPQPSPGPGRGPVPPARVLLLAIAERRFALPAEIVAGLADCGPIYPVPGAPPVVLGLAEWRGSVVTVLDLQPTLGAPPSDAPACLVRLRPPLQHIALHARAGVSLRPFHEALPVAGADARSECVAQCFEDGGRSVYLLDPRRWIEGLERELREGR